MFQYTRSIQVIIEFYFFILHHSTHLSAFTLFKILRSPIHTLIQQWLHFRKQSWKFSFKMLPTMPLTNWFLCHKWCQNDMLSALISILGSWGRTIIWFLAQSWRIDKDKWAGALSWQINHKLFCHNGFIVSTVDYLTLRQIFETVMLFWVWRCFGNPL